MKRPSLTLGIEEEYQIIDPETRALKSYITHFLDMGRQVILSREIKPELHQSQVELGTHICHNVAEAYEELREQRKFICELARDQGLAIVAAGTHPFSSWVEQQVTPFERYYNILEDMQWLARRLLIFGMHVHIGIEDREFLIDTMNVLRYFLPHLLALSTSSPFWQGRATGMKSYRSVLFQDFPRTGIPTYFSTWDDFEDLVNTLVETNCIPDGSKIWWDVRPHFKFPTLEFRIFDIVTRLDEAIALAGLIQALVAWHWDMRQKNMTFRTYRRDQIWENKIRAMRDGIEGELIDWGKEAEVPFPHLAEEILEIVDPYLDELESREYVEPVIRRVLKEGTSAERQLRVFEATGDLRAVVDHLIEETCRGVMDEPTQPG